MPEMTVDMFSTPTDYTVHASVPGINKKDISVTIEDGNVLRIEAERREERRERLPAAQSSPQARIKGTEQKQQESKEEQKEQQMPDSSSAMQTESTDNKTDNDELKYHHIESYYGHVERRLQLPDDVDLERMTARHENGVLKITLPRVPEKKQQGRKIEVQ